MTDIEIELDEDLFLPVYRPLLDCEDDIVFLWGGRDSGKTMFIAQRLLIKCLTASHFRCILIRSTFATIKDSQFQTLVDLIEEWGIGHLFKTTLSPLEIRCMNGNKFIARGCDNIQKIKSVKDPTDAWYEEGNQITEEQHITIMTTLRSNKAKIQQWFSFNPETDLSNFEDFWLFKNWVGSRAGIWSGEKTMSIGDSQISLSFTSCHTTYHDNSYVTPERRAIHEYLGQTSSYYYTVYTRGQWGNRLVRDQFAHQFDKERHVSDLAQFDPNKRLFISIDFNLSPFAITFFHMWRDEQGEHLHIFDEMSISNASIPKVIEEIQRKYGGQLHNCGLTGDYMGTNKQIGQRDNSSLYKQIRQGLRLSKIQLTLKPNPTHENSRADTNYVFLYHPDVKISPKCKETIRDLNFVECDAYGKIKKVNRENENQRADHLDTVRYIVNNFLKGWIKRDMKTRGYTQRQLPMTGAQMDKGFKDFMEGSM